MSDNITMICPKHGRKDGQDIVDIAQTRRMRILDDEG